MILILFIFVMISSIQSKNNILLIVVDDLRPALGVYNDKNAFTPNIDRLSKQSIVFQNAYAQQALCAPSRNSFLTSRRPDTLRLYDFYSYWRHVAGNFSTIPQHFKEHGYHTHSIGKVFHPGISSNFTDDAAYSWSQEPFHPHSEIYKEAKVCPTINGSLARNLICPVIVDEQPDEILPDQEILNAALRFLKQQKSTNKKPFFLAVGFHKPHVPLKYPREYLDFHSLDAVKLPDNYQRPGLLPTVAWNPWTDVRDRDDINALNIPFPFGPMPTDTMQKIIQSYNAAVTYVDDLIGTLLQEIDNTIILLLGDHGWSMGEHGEFSKFSNFEIAVRVPLILHVPKLTINTKPLFTSSLVELVDLFPTLVDLSGVGNIPRCPQDSSMISLCTEGASMVPLIVSTIKNKTYDHEKSAVFNQYPRPSIYPTKVPNSDKPRLKNIKIMGYSMRTKQYRYTEWVEFDNKHFKPNWLNIFSRELYDYFIDDNENMNLAELQAMQNITNELSIMLRKKWRR